MPVTQPIDRIFTIFQKSHKHIALVLDEHGGVAGVVTLEDIIEEVFGDIKDEKDKEEEFMSQNLNGSLAVKGNVLIDDILEEYKLSPEDVHLDEDYLGETVGYLIISLLERFPKNGEVLKLSGPKKSLHLTVEEIEDGKIKDILVVCQK